jgi:methylglutaconyl-CoA hydratase
MSSPFPYVDPDDPSFKGKSWDIIEKQLTERDALLTAASGFDVDVPPPLHTSYSAFPWEENVEPFERTVGCSHRDWSHRVLRYELGHQSATLTFNTSAKNNTFDCEMLDALQDAIVDLRQRVTVRVVILKAEGKFFSQGFDPRHTLSEGGMTDEEVRRIHVQFARILYFFSTLPQFTVALVQGSAISAAVGLLCACDMVVAVRTAAFQMNDMKLGTVPTTSLPYIMRRVQHLAHTRWFVLSAASISAEVAKEYGIVNEVVEDEASLTAEAEAICTRVTSCAPNALAVTKEIIANTMGQAPSSFVLNYVADVAAKTRKSAEASMGLVAIMERRRPEWMSDLVAP